MLGRSCVKLLQKVIFTALCCLSGTVYADIVTEQCDVVRFTAHPNYPPFHWAEDNHIVGLTPALAQRIFSTLGVESKSVNVGPWTRVLFSAQQGHVDMILGLKKTPERESYLTFTETPALQNPFAIFVLKGHEFEYQSWEDLKGRIGNMNRGDRFGETFDNFVANHLRIQRVQGLKANFDMLKLRRTDYFITGLNTGLAYLRGEGLESLYTVLDPPVVIGQIDFGFVKQSPCAALMGRFDQELAKLIGENSLKDEFAKHWQLWLSTRPVLTTKDEL